MEMRSRSSSFSNRGWTGLFSLASLEALAALVYLMSLPADAENSFFLGFSLRRLALIAILLFLSAGSAVLAWLSRKSAWCDRWLAPATRGNLLFVYLFLSLAGILASFLIPVALMSLYRTAGDFRYFAYYERLLPLFFWTGLVCLQTTIWLAWVGELQWQSLLLVKPSFRAALVISVIFALIWVFIAVTGIGIQPDLIGWGDPSVPLLEWQIWLTWLVGSLFMLYLLSHRWSARRDWFLAVAIWLLAAGLWLAQPVRTAFFATAGRPPNHEIYPFSDGAYYGLFAQSLLIGNGFQTDQVPPRPLYITLLAAFHGLAGQEYSNVITLQTLLLAFLPVVLYFIGKELHSRPAGLIIALMAILREVTAITTVAITNKASTSQLYFADLPSALAISVWALASVQWLKSSGRTALKPLLMGGTLGIAMLFRTQSIFMLLFTLLIALLSFRIRWQDWFKQTGWVLIGLSLTLTPWLYRNWQVTGHLAFDDPKTQTGVMAQRYSLSDASSDEIYTIQPGEDMQSFSNRVNQGLFSFLLNRPDVVAGFVSAHLLNSEIDNLLILAVRDGLATPSDLIMPSQPFWESWTGSPTTGQALLMIINLALIALGIGAAWSRFRWVGLSLLLMNLAYNGSNALARNSGWRYLLPIDWVSYTYAAIGLMEITIAILLILGFSPISISTHLAFVGERSAAPGRKRNWLPRLVLAGTCLTLVMVGNAPLVAELAIPKRYPEQSQPELVDELILKNGTLSKYGYDKKTLVGFLSQPNAALIKGRALYPRFYEAGDGEPRTAKAGYEPLGFPRTLFLIASANYYGLVMVRSTQPPSHLPNASDVIVIGCMSDQYLDAYAVLVLDKANSLFLSSNSLPNRCQSEPGDIP